MSIGEIIVLCFSILMCIPTLASVTKFDHWWVRGFDFPRLQISVLTIFVIIAGIIVFDFSEIWHLIVLITLGLSLGYQSVKIFPYTIFARKQVMRFEGSDPKATISILISNVLTPNKRSDKLIKLVKEKQPDILLTLESDKRWENELSEIEDDYQYTVKIPKDNLYGMHLYSKLELKDIKVRNVVQEDIPSIHGIVKLRNGKEVKLHCLHPKPPSPTESATSTNRDAELLMVGRDIDAENDTILVIGDLNDVAWSRTTKLFLKLSGMMDPRIGRGFFSTFHAGYKLLRWPLDHAFHTKDFTLLEIGREKSIGSDHFPMYIKLNHEPRAEVVNDETEDSQPEEEEWAEEKIERANPLMKKLDSGFLKIFGQHRNAH